MLEIEEINRRIVRHARFFESGVSGEGAYFAIYAPQEPSQDNPPHRVPDTLEERWFNLEYRIKALKRIYLDEQYFAGDAIPYVFVDFGCGNLAALLGSPYQLAEGTIWFDLKPIITDWNNRNTLFIHKDNPIYLSIEKVTKRLAEEAHGLYSVAITDIGANLDILTALRQRQDLLMDLIKRPVDIQETLSEINRLWQYFYEENYGWITDRGALTSCLSPLVYKGRWYKLMSECSVMISAKLFENLVCPQLQWQIDNLDRAIFNLDGTGQIHLLPSVLNLSSLHSIEWNPVPELDVQSGAFWKNYLTESSLKVCHQIQKSGKKLILTKVKPEFVVPLMEQLKSDGLFLLINCRNREEADYYAKLVKKWQTDL